MVDESYKPNSEDQIYLAEGTPDPKITDRDNDDPSPDRFHPGRAAILGLAATTAGVVALGGRHLRKKRK